MPLMLPSVVLGSVGLVWYGWTAQEDAHWAVVDVGALVYAIGAQAIGQPIQAYIIDSYPDCTSSATAASQFLRSLVAFAMPLFAPKMYTAWGYGWGNVLMAVVYLVVGGPVSLLLWYRGWYFREAQSRL